MPDWVRLTILLSVLSLWIIYVSASMIVALLVGDKLVDAVPVWVWGVLPTCWAALRGRKDSDEDHYHD